VNTAARVEAATRLTGDDILITESTLRALGSHAEDFEERPPVPLKGKTAEVRLYTPRSSIRHRVPHPKPPPDRDERR
jgi:adenylate cyclase